MKTGPVFRALALALALGATQMSFAQQPGANDLESLRGRAQGGDADAQYMLASKLHRGEGVARDDVAARALILKAARQGHLEAQRSLGLYHWRSYGGPQDKVEALKWILIAERGGNKDAANVRANMLKSMSTEQVKEAQARADAEPPRQLAKAPPAGPPAVATPPAPAFDLAKVRAAAEQGDPAIQSALGFGVLYGVGVPRDEAEGIKWLKAAAAQGDLAGLALLGGAYLEGTGVRQDRTEGIALVTRAAERGFAPAQVLLAQHYYRGEVVDRDDKVSIQWARKAAERGNKDGQKLLGAHYLSGRGVPQDLPRAEEWLRKAAAQGDREARATLQWIPLMNAVAKSPEAQAGAVELVRKGAEADNATAQYQLSRFYAEGTGVPKDKRLEVEWERKAAEQGHVEALGAYAIRLLVTLDGVKGDFWKGYSYLYRAGALGHLQSQRILGMLYQKGPGVKKDVVMSLIWLDVAVMAGDARAKELREAVLEEATPQQVAEASRRAAAWMKRPPIERTTPEGAP